MSLLLTYRILLNSCWSSRFKSGSEVFLFGLFPYAGRRRPLQRVNLRCGAPGWALTTGFLAGLGIRFTSHGPPWASDTECSGPWLRSSWSRSALVCGLPSSSCVGCSQAGGPVKAEGTISLRGSSFCFPSFLRGGSCGYPPVQSFGRLDYSAALL